MITFYSLHLLGDSLEMQIISQNNVNWGKKRKHLFLNLTECKHRVILLSLSPVAPLYPNLYKYSVIMTNIHHTEKSEGNTQAEKY